MALLRQDDSSAWKAAPPGIHPGRWVALCLSLLHIWGMTAFAQVTREVDLKAVFLFNFAQFVQWPESAPEGEFVIGIIGDHSEIFSSLAEVVRDETVRGRTLRVQTLRSVAEVSQCHILFVSPSEGHRLKSILEAARGHPVLTVSDLGGFAESGGMIEFFRQGPKLRLRINLPAATEAELRVSSKLLSLAQVINSRNR